MPAPEKLTSLRFSIKNGPNIVTAAAPRLRAVTSSDPGPTATAAPRIGCNPRSRLNTMVRALPPDGSNPSPAIDWINASSTTANIGDPINLSAGAHDPDAEPLTTQWSASDPACAFGDNTILSTAITCPNPGAITVQLQVNDTHGFAAQAFTVQYRAPNPESGILNSINLNAHTLTLPTGTITVDDNTVYSGAGSPHSLADLRPGDCLIISATAQPGGPLLAASIYRACP